MATKGTEMLGTYVNDMHTLESHILHAIFMQDSLLKDHPDAMARIRAYRATLSAHLAALDERIAALNAPPHTVKETVAATLGIAAGLYDKIRNEEASKDIRDDYTAICDAIISYTMLLTTALAFDDTATADMCKRHIEDHAGFVKDINAYMPQLVLEELRQDGFDVANDALDQARQTAHAMWGQPPHTAA